MLKKNFLLRKINIEIFKMITLKLRFKTSPLTSKILNIMGVEALQI